MEFETAELADNLRLKLDEDVTARLGSLAIAGGDQREPGDPSTRFGTGAQPGINGEFMAEAPAEENGVLLIGYSHTGAGRLHNETWHFPGLTVRRMEELLATRGLRHILRSRPTGAEGRGPSGATSNLSIGTGLGGFTNQGQFRNSALSGNSSTARTDIAGQRPTTEAESVMVLFACPMVKHNRDRYTGVHGPCTAPPGIKEFRRVK